jgi:UDP-hydrolysing UDP-N-acetyl-D-glucosamine 2-epimerase
VSGKRRIAVVTAARSEYGIYRPLLRSIQADQGLELQLIVAAAHLDPRFGTVREIEADGFVAAARIEAPLEGDGPAAVARVMGRVAAGMADALERLAPDLLVALGDRSEMEAAVSAATPFLVPVAHIAGGAVTQGAIDDGFRHAISKLSHIHFPETELQKERLLRLGEEAWRIHVVGSLSVDNALALRPLTREAINAQFGIALDEAPLLVTLHPETRNLSHAAGHAAALMKALEGVEGSIVFTYPGADAGGQVIIAAIEDFVRRHPGKAFAVPHLGNVAYFSLLRLARAMVGNSSSGIIEAASFGLPVVNIGSRQEGRMASANVIHCNVQDAEILAALARVTSQEFRASLKDLANPYGSGDAAKKMVAILRSVPLDTKLLRKAAF